MASASYHISSLLEKMTSTDKDFRFMATNDLMIELQKDSIKLDEDSEKKVVKMLLKLLEDKNGEVQNLAVKCLGPLVGKVKEYQVETIVDTLCTNMLSDKEQLRDISSIGLKTVISELPPAATGSTMTANVCKKITAQLTGAIGKQEDVSVQLEALDILSDMLSRLGGTLYSFHSSILTCLLPQLKSPRLAVRKRAIIALGHLVLTCSGNIFSELTEHLLAELKRNESTSTTRTYIQCVAGISRQAGHRIGEHLEKIVPLVVQYCNVDDDELREYCFQAFESFVRRCPKEIDPHIPSVMGLCLKYITFDPNYNYDNEEEEEEMMETENGEDEEQESDDEYSDDDDISWKVRRAAAKCLEAVVSSRHDLLQDFYRTLSPALISRFKEREENVKADIFSAYISLLKQTLPTQSWLHSSDASGKGDVPLRMLRNQVPNIVKALHKQLKEKSIKSRQGCFSLLTELANVLPGCLADHIPALVPGVVFSLADKSSSSNMRIDTLSFLHVLLCNHQPEVFHPHIKSLLPPEIGSQPKRQYLLLHSLKEVISSSPADSLTPYVEDIWALLFKHCECTEEGTRNVVAECLGKLTLVNPAELLPRLRKQLSAGSPHARSTVVTAIKFTIADQPQPIDALLKGCIGDFLQTLQDPDLNVRRVALALFNSAAHNKPSLIRDLLNVVLPSLYSETKVRRELIREVEMGPFKHTVDDGLDVRKAAFECMYTLLESCLDQLDIYEYLNHVEDGLKDHYDIRMLTFIMLARLSALCPSAVLQRLERLIEPLRATCSTKVKAGSVKQEFEKQDELKRSAMRAVAALLTIPEVEKSPAMAEFSSQIRSSPEMASLFESIQKDSASLSISESMDMS
ncbi:cullin-associated NEDD8-dissociated protein 1-like isoform X2 [Neopelma chrysocephalum]|uniref:cullin-associated NEDD8-dissociated protein 1-like isoform X2 n=1 Tax=Neopelma chrysocephalum TaxID=114329 RepID=UPI000FCD440C|nr:cullin-associated NEDD8-dissociated protein 1-like isoform X2 [Neopelma chrysocephalum]